MKKRLVPIIVIASLIVMVIGGYLLFRHSQFNRLEAEVQSVRSLNWWFQDTPMSSWGVVNNDDAQVIFPLQNQVIEEVFVHEGQHVNIGDPILAYDMTLMDLQLEIKRLEVQNINNQLVLAGKNLERLNNTTPIPDQPSTPNIPTPPEPPAPEPPVIPQIPEKDGDAYNIISVTSVPYRGTGTGDDPFRFLCTQDAYVEGSFFNNLLDQIMDPSVADIFVIFEIFTNNDPINGSLMAAWPVNASSLPRVEDSSRWSVLTRQQIVEEPWSPELPGNGSEFQPPDISIPEFPSGPQFTAEQLRQAIAEAQRAIRDLDLTYRRASLDLEQMEQISEDGLVLAQIAGYVKDLRDPLNPPIDGSPFLTIAGSEGLFVGGSVSELLLDTVVPGMTVFVNSWESGTFEATVKDVSPWPVQTGNSWQTGNPNVSFYPFVAYIADTTGLRLGEWVEITLSPGGMRGGMQPDSIFLPNAYIRTEEGQSFVFKAGEDGRLVKQYIETGRALFGQATEVLSGLTLEDRIAFPFGPNAREGVRTRDFQAPGMW